jgi:very-short-patch-repair endonuclease
MTRHAVCIAIAIVAVDTAPLASISAQGASPIRGVPVVSSESSLTKRATRMEADLPDPVLVKRWAELTADVLNEFRVDGRNPVGLIFGDFSARQVRLLTDPEREDGWVGLGLTEKDLRTLDLRTAAVNLYRAWKAAVDKL